MKIGILGTGFGAYHASIFKKLGNIESVKIFGRDNNKLGKINDELNIEITDNIYEIITDPDIDLVDVCLPSSLHKEYAIEALKNGKHVFCETPISLNLEDATAIRDSEVEYGKKVFINQFIKHEFPYQFIYEAIQNNSYGRLKAIYVKRQTPPLWGDLGLHAITTNLMIHDLDFITWLLGSPDKVSVEGIASKKGECHVNAILRYKDTVVEVQGSSMMPQYHPFTVGYEAMFEEGTVKFIEDGYIDRCEKSLVVFTNDKKEEIDIEEKNCYEETIKHVIECCQKDIDNKLSAEDAIKSLKIALQMKEMLISK